MLVGSSSDMSASGLVPWLPHGFNASSGQAKYLASTAWHPWQIVKDRGTSDDEIAHLCNPTLEVWTRLLLGRLGR